MTLPVNHILTPYDFSDTSKTALNHALQIARRKEAKVTLIHAIEMPYDFAAMQEQFKNQMSSEVEQLFSDLKEEILGQEQYSKLTIETKILYGQIISSILTSAKELSPDLLVMGTTGASDISKKLFGSKTKEIILYADVPVLAIPKDWGFEDHKHITFLTDYHEGDLEALKQTAEWGNMLNAEISVLHITETATLKAEIMHRGFRELASQKVDYPNLDVDLITGKNFLAGINEFLNIHPDSILVMVRYKKHFFRNIFNKSHSKELAHYSKNPLLVLPGKGVT